MPFICVVFLCSRYYYIAANLKFFSVWLLTCFIRCNLQGSYLSWIFFKFLMICTIAVDMQFFYQLSEFCKNIFCLQKHFVNWSWKLVNFLNWIPKKKKKRNNFINQTGGNKEFCQFGRGKNIRNFANQSRRKSSICWKRSLISSTGRGKKL